LAVRFRLEFVVLREGRHSYVSDEARRFAARALTTH
jgi:hypothetical protein